jgi:hypothetical protein
MNTNVSLSLVTNFFGVIPDLGEDLISLIVSLNEVGLMAENLDALKCGGWGVFIAPTTKRTVGGGCCRMAHRTVRCASHVTRPLGFDR